MITVLIRITHGPEALAVTLSALVPAVAAGLVADAVILSADADEAIDQVTEAAGAVLVMSEGAWSDGARLARHEWLLCLDDGDLPQEGWIRVLDRFVSLNGGQSHRARFKRRQGLWASLRSGVRHMVSPRAIRAGDLVHRRVVLGETKAGAPVRLLAAIERDPAFS